MLQVEQVCAPEDLNERKQGGVLYRKLFQHNMARAAGFDMVVLIDLQSFSLCPTVQKEI